MHRLFITQPALTKQIQSFERVIDQKLFIRGRNGATLTAIGNALYPEAKKLLQQHQKFLLFPDNIKKKANECLSIGFGISCFQQVPKWIRTFSDGSPECHIVTKQLPSSEQINLLMQGELDIAFVPASVRHFLPRGVKLISLELTQTGWDIAVAWNKRIENKKRDLFLDMNINHIKNVVV